jgi:excisionase family DNA binding protein
MEEVRRRETRMSIEQHHDNDALGDPPPTSEESSTDETPWLNTAQAARYMNVSQRYIQKLIRQLELPATLIGHEYRIHKKDLQTFMSKRRVQ